MASDGYRRGYVSFAHFLLYLLLFHLCQVKFVFINVATCDIVDVLEVVCRLLTANNIWKSSLIFQTRFPDVVSNMLFFGRHSYHRQDLQIHVLITFNIDN